MRTDLSTSLLGGLSPEAFTRRHWHRRPLLVRGAWIDALPSLDRSALFALAGRESVESRVVERRDTGWRLRQGPFGRRQLPALQACPWTLLVQGVDLHLDEASELLSRFRFVPDARLDDVMVSYANDGGGVGPHLDSYDVFLLQLSGRRHWRIGRVQDAALEANLPLKILSRFSPEMEWTLEPGDMLYLPPGWGHDGVALGECMTCSIGFRAPTQDEVAVGVLQRMLDGLDASETSRRFRDPARPATAHPGRIPDDLTAFAEQAVSRLVGERRSFECALGEWLSEPKLQVWFDEGTELSIPRGVTLDRRTRMLYDERHVFINGESFAASGRDERLMRRLSDERRLAERDVSRLSAPAFELLRSWAKHGWLRAADGIE
jgi:50S ribosomal protein L16 3-hydroxylase